jgi:predicted metal-dependent hydrolase
VIAHELLHLRIRNHGKLFTATLKAYLRGNRWAASSVRGVTK